MQSIGKAACDSIVNDPTHQRMVFYLSSYAIVIVILALLCSWWQRIIVIRPMPLM